MKVEVFCGTCHARLMRHPYRVRKQKRQFCNKECWAKAPHRETTSREDETYPCPRCGQDRHRDDFVWNRTKKGILRRRGYCKECSKSVRKEYHLANKERESATHVLWREGAKKGSRQQILRFLFSRRMSGFRNTTERYGLPACDLDVAYLVSLFEAQGGRCAYTEEPLSYAPGKVTPKTMSVDRLDPLKGYVKGNVVLCTFEANASKGQRTLQEFQHFCEVVLKVCRCRVQSSSETSTDVSTNS